MSKDYYTELIEDLAKEKTASEIEHDAREKEMVKCICRRKRFLISDKEEEKNLNVRDITAILKMFSKFVIDDGSFNIITIELPKNKTFQIESVKEYYCITEEAPRFNKIVFSKLSYNVAMMHMEKNNDTYGEQPWCKIYKKEGKL